MLSAKSQGCPERTIDSAVAVTRRRNRAGGGLADGAGIIKLQSSYHETGILFQFKIDNCNSRQFIEELGMLESKEPHIVVLGAGFGGLEFCERFNCPSAQITVVDRTNHHLFQPLLYQVATAGLSAPDIAQPIRSILSDHRHISVIMESVVDFKLSEKKVVLEGREMPYDYLVLALGGCTSYFGHPEWEAFAPGLKTLEDATQIRSQILRAFEHAESETSAAAQER